eukprot:6480861-Amphidinium_carterae.3
MAEAELLAAASKPPAGAVHAMLVVAPPVVHSAPVGDDGNLILSSCRSSPGIQLAFLDPNCPFVPEFALLALRCPSLQWVFVNNVNLAEHAGWIGRWLANTSGWHVLADHSYTMPHVQKNRQWQLLGRSNALRLPPPPLQDFLTTVGLNGKMWSTGGNSLLRRRASFICNLPGVLCMCAAFHGHLVFAPFLSAMVVKGARA